MSIIRKLGVLLGLGIVLIGGWYGYDYYYRVNYWQPMQDTLEKLDQPVNKHWDVYEFLYEKEPPWLKDPRVQERLREIGREQWLEEYRLDYRQRVGAGKLEALYEEMEGEKRQELKALRKENPIEFQRELQRRITEEWLEEHEAWTDLPEGPGDLLDLYLGVLSMLDPKYGVKLWLELPEIPYYDGIDRAIATNAVTVWEHYLKKVDDPQYYDRTKGMLGALRKAHIEQREQLKEVGLLEDVLDFWEKELRDPSGRKANPLTALIYEGIPKDELRQMYKYDGRLSLYKDFDKFHESKKEKLKEEGHL